MRSLEKSIGTAFRGKRVLVTGGAGFIGSHVVEALIAAGCESVDVVDDMVRGLPKNLAGAMRSGRVRLHEADISDGALMAQLVRGRDYVFHMAALRITQCAAEPKRAMRVMVNATFDLFSQCADAGVQKVIYSSSASVYGLALHFPTPESEGCWDNRTLYGTAKAFGEGILRSLKAERDLNHLSLRYFNVYGPRMDVHGRYTEVMIRWMDRIEAGLPPIIFGDGLQTMDFVHVADVARANLLAAVAPTTDVALNVARGEETSLIALARALCCAMGRPNLAPIHEPERSVNSVPRRLADVSLARELIGFSAEIPLEMGLKDLVAWRRELRSERKGAA